MALFFFNACSVGVNVLALVLNGGSNPVMMVVNSVCAVVSAGFAISALKAA